MRGWLKVHLPLSILQDKEPVHPILLGKGHVPSAVAKTWLWLAEGMCWPGSKRKMPESHPGWPPALGIV